MRHTWSMRRIPLLAALLFALSTATALAAAVHTGPLYPAAPAAWTGAIGAAMTAPAGSAVLPHSLMPLSAPGLEAGGRFAPVVAQLEGALNITPAAFAALPVAQRQAALEMAVEAAQVELTQKAYELSNQAKALSAPDRALDKEGRAELYRVVSQLDEMSRRYGPLLGESERESVSLAYGQAARRAWDIRNGLLGVKLKDMGAALAGAGRDMPAALPAGTPHAVKLLERMRATKSGWGADDMDALLTGFGFERREGGKHIVYVHPEFPELRQTVSRQRDLPPGYAQSAIKSIEKLGRLSAGAAPASAAAHAALPADFKLDDLAVLAAQEEQPEPAAAPPPVEKPVRAAAPTTAEKPRPAAAAPAHRTVRDLAKLSPAQPRAEPEPKAEPPLEAPEAPEPGLLSRMFGWLKR